MNSAPSPDNEALRAALAVAEARAVAEASSAEAVIAALKFMVEKLRREIYGQRSERKARLVDRLERFRLNDRWALDGQFLLTDEGMIVAEFSPCIV